MAAGIGAIALAYNALTKDAREATQANEEFLTSWQKISATARFHAERNKLTTLQEELAVAERGTLMGGGYNAPAVVVRDTREIARLQGLVADQVKNVAHWERVSREEQQRQLGVINRIRDTEAERYRAALAAMEKLVTNAKLFKDHIETAVIKLGELESGG